MIKTVMALFAATTLLMAAQPASATDGKSAIVGQPAPAFTATDTKGFTHNLGDFKGKTVVLEWTNHECPFVRKFYDGGTMQAMQKDATDAGVVWISINSGAEGKQGFQTAEQANALMESEKHAASARIIDADGTIGKMYGATTTPEMFVIDAEGTLVFAGGIDDKPSADKASLDGANNYVKAALENLAAGQPVAVSSAKPYGCGVKY
jgi:peroxiredoxin